MKQQNEVKERPILFSGEMVRAIIEDRKTQTRRAIKGMALDWLATDMFTPRFVAEDSGLCPYGYPGDRLWVRETWGVGTRPDPYAGWVDGFEYRADEAYLEDGDYLPIYLNDEFDFSEYTPGKWRPSIHMPRAASRILLEVTGIRVERLKDITAADCVCEGIAFENDALTTYNKFRRLWQSINSPESWESNPWVWVIEFKKILPA